MRKTLLLAVPLIALMAAGCSSNSNNSPQSSASQSPIANSPSVQQPSTLTAPSAAESDFKQASDLAAQQCSNLQLVEYFKNFKPADKGNTASGYKFICDDGKYVSVDIMSTGNMQTRKLTNLYYKPITLADWKVNLDSAKNIALQNGGNDFISKNSGAFLNGEILTSRTDEGFKWIIDFESQNYNSELQIFIDPTTGAILGQKTY